MIVGVSGLAGSGKDSVADRLVAEHGAVKVALADPIKRICADVFGWETDRLWGPSEKRNEPDVRYLRQVLIKNTPSAYPGDDCLGAKIRIYLTPRYALQRLGSEWARDCYPDVWIDYAVRVARELEEGGFVYAPQRGLISEYGSLDCPSFPYTSVIVPDVRFRNEVEGLRKAGAKLVRVKRVGYEKPRFDHPSETEQMTIPDSEFDCVIENDSTLEVLGSKVDTMWKELSK